MSLNRTVSDLKVKKILIQRRSGNSWVSLPSDKRINPGTKYRTSFDLASYDTHHADCLFHAYLMFAAGTPSYNVTKLRWSNGIYASVRNRKWRERAKVVS